jgi:hypothetical protein
MLSQRQQSAALGLLIGRELFPLRAADAAKEDGIGLFAGFDGLFGERLAHGINGGTADEFVVVVEVEAGTAGDGVEDANGFGHDFRADAVAGEDCEVVGFGHVGKGGVVFWFSVLGCSKFNVERSMLNVLQPSSPRRLSGTR